MLLTGAGAGRGPAPSLGHGQGGHRSQVPEVAPRALTRLVPIKLRVEVLPRVKGHLDLISHGQPFAGDRLTQVLGQGSSKAQAGAEAGRGYSLSPPSWASAWWRFGQGSWSDLFWTSTLVYTELLTPEWYSSGGMTPGHTSEGRCLSERS